MTVTETQGVPHPGEITAWGDDVDVVFTTDHGELQGDFGLLFKGPYHVDGLMRLPLVWRPARRAAVAPAVVRDPVGLVDLAPTFLQIAGVDPADFPEQFDGRSLLPQWHDPSGENEAGDPEYAKEIINLEFVSYNSLDANEGDIR